MIRLVVNGETHELEVEPHRALLWVLRHRVRVAGLKSHCEVGACGTCTIFVDGRPVQPCVTPVAAVDGAHVTTKQANTPH